VTFTPTDIKTSADVRVRVAAAFPEASNSTVDTLLTDVYPDVLNGSEPWQAEFARAVQLSTDAFFACTTAYLAEAKGNATHNYIFAYPPGFHGDDVPYTFFNGESSVKADLAIALQDYLVAFAKMGDPNTPTLPKFPEYGKGSSVLRFSEVGITSQVDDMRNRRCKWLQQAMIDGRL
jgi:carboxylesterase type B